MSETLYALSDDDMRLMNEAANSEIYRKSSIPDELRNQLNENLTSFVHIPLTSRSNLYAIYPTGFNIENALNEDWKYALQIGALRLYDAESNKVNFPLRMARPNGKAIEVAIAPSTFEGSSKPWYLSFVPSLDFVKTSEEALSMDETSNHDSTPEPYGIIPGQAPELLAEVAERDDYRTSPLSEEMRSQIFALTTNQTQGIFIPSRWQEKLDEAAGFPVDTEGLLKRDLTHDLNHGLLRQYENKVLFPVSILRPDGKSAVEVSLKSNEDPNTSERKPWILWGVDFKPRRVISPRRALEKWASMGQWPEVLRVLEEESLDEIWDFDEEDNPAFTHSILYNYLVYTFYRLQSEDKVLENRERGIAAFNTGLVNKTYEPIFACFSPREGSPAWRFEAFCKQGSGYWGKKLVAAFNPLPARAQYFQEKDDLLYDSDRKLILDRDHILLDNIDRLPAEFLEEELRGSDDALKLLEQVKQVSDSDKLEELYGSLREIVERDSKLKRRLINRLQDAVDLAKKRAEWNFRTAVPSFYPARDSMSLLLPLDLTDNARPDIALVVELQDSGAYLGQTILSMRMAYNNARLICRPDSDWLNTSVRLATSTGDSWHEE